MIMSKKDKPSISETEVQDQQLPVQETDQLPVDETEVQPQNTSANSSEPESISDDRDKQIQLLDGQLKTTKDQLMRVAAEFENYKRRNEQEKIDLLRYGGEKFAKDLLNVMDDLERSLSAAQKSETTGPIVDGVKLIQSNLSKTMEKHGVKPLIVVGEKFDVEKHEALMHVDKPEVEPDTVVEEVQKGYSYHDKVIRYAKVLVSK